MADIIKIDDFPKIEADCFISLGKNCRPARWLEVHGLRYCSLPFDWLMHYSLQIVLNCIKNKSFPFQKCVENSSKNDENKYIYDVKNKIVSVHDFPLDKTIKEYMPVFKKTFKRQSIRLRRILSTYNNICFVCSRDDDISMFLAFTTEIVHMYPRMEITVVNIRNSPDEHVYVYHPNDFIMIYDIHANDIHEKGNKKENNPDYWLGNVNLWNKICSHFSLSEKVIKELAKHNNIDVSLQEKCSFWCNFFVKKSEAD